MNSYHVHLQYNNLQNVMEVCQSLSEVGCFERFNRDVTGKCIYIHTNYIKSPAFNKYIKRAGNKSFLSKVVILFCNSLMNVDTGNTSGIKCYGY